MIVPDISNSHTVKILLIVILSFYITACVNHTQLTERDGLQHVEKQIEKNTPQVTTNGFIGDLKIATWNVEHLSFPISNGCKPRTESEIDNMRQYIARVDADIFALQEVASTDAVRLLFPEKEWQVFISPRRDSEPYTCRKSGSISTQQKTAFAIKKGIRVNSTEGISLLGLDISGLRYGLEINVTTELGPIAILNVHMKSGCFVDNFSRSDSNACAIFAKQAAILDEWVESKESQNEAYMILGDFNHRLSAPYNHLTQMLSENRDNSRSTLLNTTSNLIGCHPYYPAPIDMIFVGNMPQTNSPAFTLNTQAHNFDKMKPEEMLSDHCAVSLSIKSKPLPISNAVKWLTQSQEYDFLTRKIYQQAQTSLSDMELHGSNWVVVMDVDETVLDNSSYQVILEQQGKRYSSDSWDEWVMQEQAKLVPGAADFIQHVLEQGGKLALVTNRNNRLDKHTWQNLIQMGLKLNSQNTCLLGRSALDKAALVQDNISNDKDRRRQQLIEGNPACYRPKTFDNEQDKWLKPHTIVMEVGDNIEDFMHVTQEQADLDVLLRKSGSRLILLPNPMYGSW